MRSTKGSSPTLPPTEVVIRWARWPARCVSQPSLAAEARARVYTAQGPANLQPALWAVVALLQARVPLDRDAGRAHRPQGQGLEETQTAWQTWTRRLAASLARRAAVRRRLAAAGGVRLLTRDADPTCQGAVGGS